MGVFFVARGAAQAGRRRPVGGHAHLVHGRKEVWLGGEPDVVDLVGGHAYDHLARLQHADAFFVVVERRILQMRLTADVDLRGGGEVMVGTVLSSVGMVLCPVGTVLNMVRTVLVMVGTVLILVGTQCYAARLRLGERA